MWSPDQGLPHCQLLVSSQFTVVAISIVKLLSLSHFSCIKSFLQLLPYSTAGVPPLIIITYFSEGNKSDLEDQIVTSCWKINTTLHTFLFGDILYLEHICAAL
jgi:hypothetical protein